MAESHVVTGLIAKHTELAGQIQYHKNEIARLASEITHLDATLKLFSPEFDLRKLGVKRVGHSQMGGFKYFKRGESQRLTLDILRETDAPMATIEIVVKVIEKKGLDDTKAVRGTLLRTLTGTLHRLESRGAVHSAQADKGRTLNWALV